MVSSWELLMIWNSSNWRRNTRPECSWRRGRGQKTWCYRTGRAWIPQGPTDRTSQTLLLNFRSTKNKKRPLTTRVRRHNVLAGARGSNAAWRSQTLILLQMEQKTTVWSTKPECLSAQRGVCAWLTHHKRRWQSFCCRSGCNAQAPRDPPGLANMPRTRCPITWQILWSERTALRSVICQKTPFWFHDPTLKSSLVTYRIVLSEEPLTTRRSLYCRQAMPRLWPFSVRTNSHVLVLHTYMWPRGKKKSQKPSTVACIYSHKHIMIW